MMAVGGRLLADKRALGARCEALVGDLKKAEERHQTRLQALKEGQDVAVQRQKEVSPPERGRAAAEHLFTPSHTWRTSPRTQIISTSEKAKRDKWVAEQTKKIKELTIKGLEPEIERLVAAHKAEVAQLHAEHRAALASRETAADVDVQRRLQAHRQDLEAQLAAAAAQERDALRRRYEQLAETEEKRFLEEVCLWHDPTGAGH